MRRILIPCILFMTIIGCDQSEVDESEFVDLLKNEKVEQKTIIELELVKIGTQIWTTSNLNVDTFQNGDPIPEAKTSEEWNAYADKKEAVWCYYNFDSTNDSISGKLYNWYVIDDPRGIAPNGWHVATNDEWLLLINFAGRSLSANQKLKSKTGWTSPINEPDNNGTDNYGFGAKPTGELHRDGVFAAHSTMGVWWTSSKYDGAVSYGSNINDFAWDIVIWYSENMKVKRQRFPKRGSGSIRCVRDQ